MQRATIIRAVALSLLFATSAWALNPDRTINQYNCRTWRRDNGLPVNSVNAIAIAEDGRVWLATSRGLVNFDGVEFHVLSDQGKSAIQGRVVTTVAARAGGGLWYGLDNGGYGFFDGKTTKSVPWPSWVSTEPTVRSMRETRDGHLIVVGTSGAGRAVGGNLLERLYPENVDFFSIHEDAQGRLWLGTAERGLFFWDNGTIHPFPDTSLYNNVIQAVATDSHGNLWLATANGVVGFDEKREQIPLPTLPPVKTLYVDHDDVLWIGTYGGGVFRLKDGELSHFTRSDGLASNDVLAFAESKDGSLWIGTSDGLTQLSDLKFPAVSRSDGLVYDSALCVAPGKDGALWIGTPNGFSIMRDGKFSNFGTDKANGLTSVWVKRIYPTENGDAYLIGGQKNIDHFSNGNVVEHWQCDSWPRDVVEDDQGLIFAIARKLMRVENGHIVPYLLKNGEVAEPGWINSVMMAPDKTLWLATEDGLFRLKDGVLTDCCLENGLPKIRYDYLALDNEGNLWSALQHGIARCKNGKMRIITHEQGLHEDYVYAMVPDSRGDFWMDSNLGIFRVSQADLNAVADGRLSRVSCRVFEGSDAVKTTDKVSIEYSGARTPDGRIWFPTSKGVVMIDPNHIPENVYQPLVSIDQVRVNGGTYLQEQSGKIELGPGNLEFDYSALEYLAPQKIQYRYRLIGLDKDWVMAGNRRSAFYTNLSPGSYQFEVQASNTDGVWNPSGASVSVRLPRRYYETNSFRIGIATLLLGTILYLWWMRRVHQTKIELEKANALMEEKVRERTAELRAEIDERKKAQEEALRLHDELRASAEAAKSAAKAKSQFLANMSHEIRTPMNAVIGMSNLLLETSLDSHQQELAETTRNSAEALLTVLNDILDFSKMEAGKLHLESLDFNLPDAVEESIELMTVRAAEKGVELACFVSHDLPPVLNGDPTRLRQVMLNLLGNAVKFTEKGEIVVSVTREPSSSRDEIAVRFEVRDSGIGMSPVVQKELFKPFMQADSSTTRRFGGTGLGLAICQQIVTLMGGSIGVNSSPGSGSTFWFVIPYAATTSSHVGTSGLPGQPKISGLRALFHHSHGLVEKVVRHLSEGWGVEIVTARSLLHASELALEAEKQRKSFDVFIAEPSSSANSQDESGSPMILVNGRLLPVILVTTMQSLRVTAFAGSPQVAATVPTPIRGERLRRALLAVAGRAAPIARTTQGDAVAQSVAPFRATDLRILVAEDNVVNQRVVQLQLRRAGYDADIVANGLEVLREVKSAKYDVIFMDCQMPELDGYETTRQLRQIAETRDVFIIAMTANSLDGDRERCLNAGMDAYLSKPTRERDLAASLDLARKSRQTKKDGITSGVTSFRGESTS